MDVYSIEEDRVMNNTSHTQWNDKTALMIVFIILILTSCSAKEGELRNQTTGKILMNGQEQDFILTTDDITQVDFANFTFPVSPGQKMLLPIVSFKVVDRVYRYKEDNGKRVEFYQSKNIIFDNVTGKDVNKDAIIVFTIVSGDFSIGTGREHCIYIYTIYDKQLKLIWYIDTGDRSAGGLRDVYGEDGNLIVETYNSDVIFDSQGNAVPGASCCSKTYTRAVYQWTGVSYQLIEAKRYDNPLNFKAYPIDNHKRIK